MVDSGDTIERFIVNTHNDDSNVKRSFTLNNYNEEQPTAFTAGLYKQLIGKNRQKSQFYNILLLTCFNMNTAHYCLPYLTASLGSVVAIGLVILSVILSSLTQKLILSFLTNYRSECNYSKVVETSLGSFMSYFVEVLSIIWYISLLITASMSVEQAIQLLFPVSFYTNNENLITIIVLIVLFFLYILLNRLNKPYVTDLYVFFCLSVHIISIVLSILNLSKKGYSTAAIEPIKGFNSRRMFDIINITAISSNNIVLNFWVHSKYSVSTSADNSSSIVNVSSVIIGVYYCIVCLLSSFTYESDSKISKFNLYETTIYDISNYEVAFIILNSVAFLIMINFFFKCIKEVVLRKEAAYYLNGKRYYLFFIPICIIALTLSYYIPDPYYIIVGTNSIIGVLLNYIIPVLICIKFSDQSINSFVNMTTIGIIYLLFCICLSSSYLNFSKIFNWGDFDQVDN